MLDTAFTLLRQSLNLAGSQLAPVAGEVASEPEDTLIHSVDSAPRGNGQASHAVFLDNNGVITRVQRPAGETNLRDWFIPGALDAIARLSKYPSVKIVLVTNHSEGRGTPHQREELLRVLNQHVQHAGGRFDAIYYCTTAARPPAGQVSGRKPEGGMLLRAAQDLDIDLAHSYMIGDQRTDVAAGKDAHAGMTTILVKTGHWYDTQADAEPDRTHTNLSEAVNWIIARESGATDPR